MQNVPDATFRRATSEKRTNRTVPRPAYGLFDPPHLSKFKRVSCKSFNSKHRGVLANRIAAAPEAFDRSGS